MLRNIGAPEIIIIAVLLILILGWKRLPDAARSLGRSMRVFKSEVNEMKNDGKSTASGETVPGRDGPRHERPRHGRRCGHRPRDDGHLGDARGQQPALGQLHRSLSA